ncbi:MAG TPA: serine hydrolase domain-containing protein [Caulobacteraceae bacterium]|nr:serine hydrolase domain-containing protein [Caulobacteraceae bacterium]
MRITTRSIAFMLAFAVATTAAAKTGDVLPPKDKSILFWSPAEQAAGYRRIEDVLPTHVVKRGTKVHALPKASGPEPQINFTVQGKTYDTKSYMDAYRVSGILIIKDGKIVLERYGLGRTAADRWTSFSVAKSVTSTLIGAAIKDGYIKSIDDPVTQYIPELKGSAYEGVTIKQLLTMSSGVKWNEDYTDPNSDVARSGFEPVKGKINPIVAYMRRLPREAAPGTKFVYKTGETDLAGILLSNAVHKTMSQYASEKIWKPYGMEKDAVWMLDPAGHERGGCCMSITLRDYGRIGEFMLDGGAGQLPDWWVKEATRKQIDTVPGGARGGYGFFWWMDPHGYNAIGIFGQMIHIDPAEKLVIVTNSAWPKATGRDLSAAREAFIEAATKAVH